MKISSLSLSLTYLLVCLTVGDPPAFAAFTRVKLDISNVRPGSIVIRHGERKLYFVESAHVALRYPVAVPKPGAEWWGSAAVVSKHDSPAWTPPAEVKRAHPELPDVIPGGSPNNPMGTKVLMLNLPEIAIHGTSNKMRPSVLRGQAASFGCIRMLDEDIQDLFRRVSPGTQVLMLR